MDIACICKLFIPAALTAGLCCTFAADAAAAGSAMKIAADGIASCTIVIPVQAADAEKHAANELALFLGEMTGAQFQITDDSVPASGPEIVLGNANRLNMDDVPESLRPQKQEGFVILRRGSSLFIMGMIPRATLYGVYDMLEQELGCRFLADDANYIPKHRDLQFNFKDRKYDPPLEYRCIWFRPGEDWRLRSRLNGVCEQWVPREDAIGGVHWLLFCHTSSLLVPWAEYSKEHPEYYAMIDGKRTPYMHGVETQLCLTNPDIFEIALNNAKKVIDAANKACPQTRDNKFLLSVSENDNNNFCQCDACRKVNEEEGSGGGTLIRFVNHIARELGKDYKNVEVETLGYGMMRTPPKTAPEKNVLIRWCNTIDEGYPLDSKENAGNWEVYKQLAAWHKVTSRVYRWGYYTDGGDYYMPYSGIDYLDHNMRVLVKNGVLGQFVQNGYDAGSDFQRLKSYLFAQIMWRPETDVRKAAVEFCNLYYGKGAGKVWEYFRYINDNYRGKRSPKYFDVAFANKADALLGEAERLADSPEAKHRVAILRLSIWKMRIDRALLDHGKVADLPGEWRFRFDENNAGIDEKWYEKRSFRSWRTIKTDSTWLSQGVKELGVGWYATDFQVPDRPGNYVLRFGAVDGQCDIYVDGKKLAEQKADPARMWATPYEVQLPKSIAPGRHTLVVRVEKHIWNAGIWRPVSLVDRDILLLPETKEACERFLSVGPTLPIIALNEGVTYIDIYYQEMQSLLDTGAGYLCKSTSAAQ